MRNTANADECRQLMASALETLLNVVSSEKRSETAFRELLVQVQYSQVELDDQQPVHWLHMTEAAGRAKKAVQKAEKRGEPDYALESLLRISNLVLESESRTASQDMQRSYHMALSNARRAKEVSEDDALSQEGGV